MRSLALNLKALIRSYGLEKVGFLTLTFAENLQDRREAQRRFNNFTTGFLREHVQGYIAAAERQQRGAIHYHLCIALRVDIRSGFDFEAAREAKRLKAAGDKVRWGLAVGRYTRSSNHNLREWWSKVRVAASRYGFGRCETLPVLSNEDGIAYYVGGYVTSEWRCRKGEDKGMRTLRYGLARGVRVASAAFGWAEGAGRDWRDGCSVVAGFVRVRDLSVIGRRWAFELRQEVGVCCRHWKEILSVPMELRGDTVAERVKCLRVICRRILIEEGQC